MTGGRARNERDGWRQPDNLGLYELDSLLSARETATLQALMMVGHADLVEFLG